VGLPAHWVGARLEPVDQWCGLIWAVRCWVGTVLDFVFADAAQGREDGPQPCE
jgi:hypothetical protein